MYYNLHGVELTFFMNVRCNDNFYENRPCWLPRKSDKVTVLNAIKIKGQNPNVRINVEDELGRLRPLPRKEDETLQFSTSFPMTVTALDFENGKKLIFTAFIAKQTSGSLFSLVKKREEEIRAPQTVAVETDHARAQKITEEQLDGGKGKNGDTRRSRSRSHEEKKKKTHRLEPNQMPLRGFRGKSSAELVEADI